jgi:alpha-galactosidase
MKILLVSDLHYRLRWRQDAGWPASMQRTVPEWFARGEAVASGRVLERSGVQLPNLNPGHVLLLHLTPA